MLSSLRHQELIQRWRHKTQAELSIELSCQDTPKRPGPQRNQLFRQQEKRKHTYSFLPNQQNLRTPACKIYQLLLAPLKSPSPPSSKPHQRLLLPSVDKVEVTHSSSLNNLSCHTSYPSDTIKLVLYLALTEKKTQINLLTS